MASRPAPQQSVRFGIFEVDLSASQLLKRGRNVKLQDQPLQVLSLLLRRPGEVVTREELQKAVWPADTFVEFDQGLNTAIKKIRQALGDSAENPRFIETIPRHGYRFIAPVEKGEVSAPAPTSRRRGLLWVFITLGAVVVAVSAVWFFRINNTPVAVPVPVPLTSYLGEERSPSFSPDGHQVAFTWNGPRQDNFDIYIKLIGVSEPVRLTKDPADEYGPAWSPDGRWIAFLRARNMPRGSAPAHRAAYAERSDIFLVPAIGGPERKLAEVQPSEQLGPYVSWHPSGKWLVISDKNSAAGPRALFLRSVETGEKRSLTSPPQNFIEDVDPAVSPDGHSVVFVRSRPINIADLYLLELSQELAPKGEPRRITFGNRYTGTPAWLPDGRSILFSWGSITNPSLWRMVVHGSGGRSGKPERLAFAGEGARQPTISREGRLVYTQLTVDTDIWQLELSGWQSGKAIKPAVRLITSTRFEDEQQYSPDGKRIAFVSDRSGSPEIWVCNSDGSNPVQLTSFGGPRTGIPFWSPDGQWVVFTSTAEGRTGVYLIHSDGGKPQRLMNVQAEEEVATSSGWSRDGNWIYFISNRTGESQVWKMPWEPSRHSGDAIQITRRGGDLAKESPDGGLLYYRKADQPITSLWKVPVNGGQESQVLEAVYGHSFAVIDRGIYFIPSPERPSLHFLNFATGKVVTIATIPKMPAYGFSVSPDGRWLLYSGYEERGCTLMLVENFR